jgi:hypothetical protein
MPSLTDIVMEKESEETNDHDNSSGRVAGLIVDRRTRGPDNIAN